MYFWKYVEIRRYKKKRIPFQRLVNKGDIMCQRKLRKSINLLYFGDSFLKTHCGQLGFALPYLTKKYQVYMQCQIMGSKEQGEDEENLM